MKTSLRFLFVLIAVVLQACSTQSKPTLVKSEKKTLATQLSRHVEFQRDMGRFATRSRTGQDLSVKSYVLKGSFNWEKRELDATVEMTFRLLCSCQDSYVLDSQVEEILSVTLQNNGQTLGYNQINSRDLAIDLSQVPEVLRKKDLTVAIHYRAKANLRGDGEASSLVAVDRLPGDPIKSRMVFTYAEPQDASLWMPCVNDPSYRALFSAELKMPVSEMLISNGDLVRNEVQGESRWVKYQTRYPLPTYLMAFAQGQLSIATQYHGALPVSVVTREGLHADTTGLLKETIRQIQHYEKLLVPYPFEKYMLVLAPEFVSGGIEHAGITFVDEGSASQSKLSRDVGLTGHELAHQWFGDLVTISSWDDLWIKEGMATLLAEESMRPYEDAKGTGRLMGREFSVTEGESILDTTLIPDEKYTDGPYGRAAWLLTQVRSTLGEEVFWDTLRRVLQENRFLAISTPEFLEYFRIAGGDSLVNKMKQAINAKALPTFGLVKNGGVFSVSLADPEGSMLIPLELTWHSESGSIENEVLLKDKKLDHLVNDVRLLALDRRDLHPLEAFHGWEKLSEIVDSLQAPRNSEQVRRFLTFGSHSQLRGLQSASSWKIKAEEFKDIYEAIGSQQAKFLLLEVACKIAKGSGVDKWKGELTKSLLDLPYLGIPSRDSSNFGACREIIGEGLFLPFWERIKASPESNDLSTLQLYFASLLPMSTSAQGFETWSMLANAGPDVRSRKLGLQNLLQYLEGKAYFPKPEGSELKVWHAELVKLLRESRSGKFLSVLVPALGDLRVVEALPELARVMRSETHSVWRRAYCAAQEILGENPQSKAEFDRALGDIKTLPTSLQSFLQNPKGCKK